MSSMAQAEGNQKAVAGFKCERCEKYFTAKARHAPGEDLCHSCGDESFDDYFDGRLTRQQHLESLNCGERWDRQGD